MGQDEENKKKLSFIPTDMVVTDPLEGLFMALKVDNPDTVYLITLYEFEDTFNIGIIKSLTECFNIVNEIVNSNKQYLKNTVEILKDFKKNHSDYNAGLFPKRNKFNKNYGINYTYYIKSWREEYIGSHLFVTSDRSFTSGFSIQIKPFTLNVPFDYSKQDIAPQNNQYMLDDYKSHLEWELKSQKDYLEDE